MKLLSFGEILFDIYEDAECLGGAPLNLGAHAALQGAEVKILSAVGNDMLGVEAVSQIKELGINTEYIRALPDKETGKCIVTLDNNAVPSYNLLKEVAYDYIPCPEFGEDESFDVFAFGTLALRGEHNFETVKKIIDMNKCAEIYSDLNIRPPFYSEKSIKFCFENATIVKISDEELPLVTRTVFGKEFSKEDAVRTIAEHFSQIKLIVITCGGEGSCAYDCVADKMYSQKAQSVRVVSTVGAGDSFGATFLVQYFNGKEIQKCLAAASEVSAYVVSQKGAIPDGMNTVIEKVMQE